jgi:hypothetical protein
MLTGLKPELRHSKRYILIDLIKLNNHWLRQVSYWASCRNNPIEAAGVGPLALEIGLLQFHYL